MSDIPTPINRKELYLAKIGGADVQIPSKPLNRYETYLAKMAGQNVEIPADQITREEAYLKAIIDNGGGGGGGGDTTFAFVLFKYTAGTTITATNGTKTLKSDNSGEYVFAIPSAGTWTFTDGVNSKDIVIDTYGTAISARFTLLIYSDGDDIVSEASVYNFVAGESNWGGLAISSGLAKTTDGNFEPVHVPFSSYMKKTFGENNADGTAYIVMKMLSDSNSFGRAITFPYNDREDNNQCPCWLRVGSYMNYGSIGVETATSVNPYDGNYHVYGLGVGAAKVMHACIDGGNIGTRSYGNNGGTAWFTYSTTKSQHCEANVLFAAVVDKLESDEVIKANCAYLKEYFGI